MLRNFHIDKRNEYSAKKCRTVKTRFRVTSSLGTTHSSTISQNQNASDALSSVLASPSSSNMWSTSSNQIPFLPSDSTTGEVGIEMSALQIQIGKNGDPDSTSKGKYGSRSDQFLFNLRTQQYRSGSATRRQISIVIFVIYTTYTAQPDIRYIDRALDWTITNHISPDQKL